MPYFLKKSLENVFDPSNWAAALEGPNTLILFDTKKSVNPLTRGCSGQIITK